MAGLLDLFDDPSAQLGLGLLAAASPRADGAGFGQRLMEGVQSAGAMRDAKYKRDLQQMQAEEIKRKFDAEKAMRLAAQNSVVPATAATPAVPQAPLNIATDTGPNLFSRSPSNMSTPGQAAVAAQPASFDADKFVSQLWGIDPDKAISTLSALAKDDTPVVVPEGGTLYSKRGKFLAMGSPKKDTDPKITQYEYAVRNGYKGSFDKFITLGPEIMAAAAAGLRNAQTANIIAENDYNLPPPRAAAPQQSGVVVVDPTGGRHVFPDQKSANNFKLKAGIK